MNILKSVTFEPSLGWLAGGLLAGLLLLLALALVIHGLREGRDTDADRWALTRRTAMVLILALMVMTPSTVSKTTNKAVNATDVFIAVDVTGSMAVKDAGYGDQEGISRLEAARAAVHDLTRIYPDASFSALSFGASASVDLPLTPDVRAVDNWARGLATEPTSRSSGSSLDAPLDRLSLVMKQTRDRHPDDRILLYLISDGEQTGPDERRSFSVLREGLDDAFVLGTGSAKGGMVPLSSDVAGSDADGWVTDPKTGQPGISAMDPKTLKAMADEMSGHYQALAKGATVREGATATASKRYRVTRVDQVRQHVTPLVWPLALVELALILIEAGLWVHTSRRLL
ncbi:VWA domain-containing protein [Bifidobacterium sp. W8113]|uniref:vWA domain-containing protein n=1 Tax=Bifidobacterium choladohabitans TaxID=2750947 RepID=UPI0018DB91D8|nr:VWA domain-containing protein [Bifidobacterium choladohabitans]MBI0089247.1 VWA domain-containing protein [Bifidobacterium choladohabitans]